MSNLIYRIVFPCLLSVGMCIEDYGPFLVNVRRLEKCKGSKPSECADYECWQGVDRHEMYFKVNVSRNCIIRQFKVELSTIKNNSSKKMFNYMFDKPCQHFLLGKYVKELFDVGDNCKVSKGSYTFMLDAAKLSPEFFGSNFFYGTWQMKIYMADRNCNLFCLNAVSAFEKRTA